MCVCVCVCVFVCHRHITCIHTDTDTDTNIKLRHDENKWLSGASYVLEMSTLQCRKQSLICARDEYTSVQEAEPHMC